MSDLDRKEEKSWKLVKATCHVAMHWKGVPLMLLRRQKFNSCLQESWFIPILCVNRFIRNSEIGHSSILRFQVRLMTIRLHPDSQKTEREKDWMLNCIHAWLLHTEFTLPFAGVQKFNIKDYSIRDQLFLYAIYIYCTTELYQQLEVFEKYSGIHWFELLTN